MAIQTTPLSDLPFPELEDTADVPRDVEALAEKLDGAIVPIGGIIMWYSATLPSDAWRFCDGTVLDEDDFAALAAIIPAVAGVITLPNLVGRVAMGAGPVPLSSPAQTAALKSVGGRGTVKLTARQSALVGHGHTKGTLANSAVGSHSHGGGTGGMNANNPHSHTSLRGTPLLFNTGNGAITAAQSAGVFDHPGTSATDINHIHAINPDGAHNHTISGAPANVADGVDARDEHTNLPPYLAVNHIIRVL